MCWTSRKETGLLLWVGAICKSIGDFYWLYHHCRDKHGVRNYDSLDHTWPVSCSNLNLTQRARRPVTRAIFSTWFWSRSVGSLQIIYLLHSYSRSHCRSYTSRGENSQWQSEITTELKLETDNCIVPSSVMRLSGTAGWKYCSHVNFWVNWSCVSCSSKVR